MSFVEVPADAIRTRLIDAGFERAADADNEEVYYRAHKKNPDMAVKVFTTIPLNGAAVRDCGRDAIRIVALKRIPLRFGNPKTVCIYKAQRVFRTGTVEGVLQRMIERARLAYAALNADRKGGGDRG